MLTGKTLNALTFCAAVIVGAQSVLACQNPSLHPEMASFLARSDALASQPNNPLQMKYRIAGDPKTGESLPLMLSFWPTEPVEQTRYRARPSDGLTTSAPEDWSEFEAKGGVVEFEVTPLKDGYPYVEIDTQWQTAGGESVTHTALIAVPTALEHKVTHEVPGGKSRDPLGFAGDKLRTVIEAR